MNEFMAYLEWICFEVERGRLHASDARQRFATDWGGVNVRGYVPKLDPALTQQVRDLIAAGVPERTARRKIRGK